MAVTSLNNHSEVSAGGEIVLPFGTLMTMVLSSFSQLDISRNQKDFEVGLRASYQKPSITKESIKLATPDYS